MNRTPSCFESIWRLLNQFWYRPDGIGYLTKWVYYDRNCRYQLFLSVLISTIHYIYKQGILTAIYWNKNWMYSWNSGHQFYLDRPILVLPLRLWNYTTENFHFVFQRYLEKLVFRRYMEKRPLSLSTIYSVGKYI